MLIYTRRAPPKAPKRRSRAGCIHCKEKKKKCNEKRPQCDRCIERNLQCEYEPVKPRKRRRISFAASQDATSPTFCDERWLGRFERTFSPGNLDENGFHKWEAGSNFQYPESDTSSIDEDNTIETSGDVEEIFRTDQGLAPSTAIVRSRSQYPDLAMIAPSPAGSPLLEFSAPVFQEFTEMRNRRALIDHFCNVLSHLIVFKEDTGNPFRQLILPLSHGSSPVMNALFALSSAHLEYRGIENQEKSLDFHNKALQGLAMLIDQNDPTSRAEVLGAIILLVYYEVLVQRGNSNIVNGHLKGAMAIMKSGPPISTPATQFLERAFRFYDVIAALSLGTAPNTTNLPTSNSYPAPPTTSFAQVSPLGSVDTLLGLSTDLWPIIHRLSHLLSYKVSLAEAIAAGQTSKATVLRTELESTSQAIELALKHWKPNLVSETTADSPDGSSDSSSTAEEYRLQSILNNAEAYRQSAFVYLYRTIHSHPRSHPLVQKHSHLSLEACSNVVDSAEKCHDGPMSALLWPLFVAACEATSRDDRALAKDAFAKAEKRQGMNNIARAWEVVQEVWRREDLGEDNVDWKQICTETGCSIVFG